MAKSKPKNWALGLWSIDSMSMWDKDYIDEEVPGYFEFGPDDLGSFQFGYVQGDVDYRVTERGDKPAVEFSFEGQAQRACRYRASVRPDSTSSPDAKNQTLRLPLAEMQERAPSAPELPLRAGAVMERNSFRHVIEAAKRAIERRAELTKELAR